MRRGFYCAMLEAKNSGKRAHANYKHIDAEQAKRVWAGEKPNKYWRLLYLVRVTLKPKVKS